MTAPEQPRRHAPGSIAAQAALAVLLVLAVMAVAYLLNARAEQSIERAQQSAIRARVQGDAAVAVLDALRDAETGQRGFLLTMRDDYLQPYTDGLGRLDQALKTLDEAVSRTPALEHEAAALREVAHRKTDELAQSLRTARSSGRQAASDPVLTDAGKDAMNGAREIVAHIVADANADRDRQLRLLRARERNAANGVAIAAALGALLLGTAVLVLLLARQRLSAARDALQRQGARLAGAVEHMRDGVAVFDAAGRLVLANHHLLGNTRWPPTLLRPGARFADFAAAAADWPGAPLAAPELGGLARSSEVEAEGRMLEVWRSPMPDGGQMLTVADITRRVEAEALARQAQKMDALGQLTGGVAHDFNNLLQIVSANLELVAARIGADDWLQARLAAAMSGVERAARLTRHLLAFARRQPLAPEAVDTRALLAGMEDMLRRTLGERIEVELVLSGSLWPLRADPQQLENALLNLAINARDAMPDGGKLTIEAANAALDDQYAAGHAEVTPGQYVVIAVTDTGMGMTADQLGRALEPFYTTKPDGRGTGLGLPMVFGFSKQSAGHFKLYSEPGHGTTARLYIPRSYTAPRAAQPEPPRAPAAQGELVLVVEDDPTVRAASVQAVRSLGYRVIEAASAADGLAQIDAGAKPDLLFTDVVMPGVPSSREMAERARAVLPNLAVVFTSGYTENAIVHNGQLDPGVILVSKPWRTEALARKLRYAIEHARRAPEPKRRLRILLVEDEMLVRMTSADLLADLGHEVMEAADGAQALAALATGADLLITDLGLPDMDGMALVAEARARQPGLRVIIASGRDVPPAEGYTTMAKPYDLSSLKKALARAFGEDG